MIDSEFWNATRLAGLVLVLGSLAPFIPTLGVAVKGEIRAAEAMFRELGPAVGHITSFRIVAFTWAVWSLVSLAGFIMLSIALWERGVRTLAVMAVVGYALYAAMVMLEAAFHVSVTAWAIDQIGSEAEVPEIFFQLRRWLNVYLQILANPLALLSFIALAVSMLRTDLLWPVFNWGVLVWSAAALLFPLPLLIAPVPVVIGIALIVGG